MINYKETMLFPLEVAKDILETLSTSFSWTKNKFKLILALPFRLFLLSFLLVVMPIFFVTWMVQGNVLYIMDKIMDWFDE